MKFKVPEGCTSISLGGENIEIKDGFIEADRELQFLIDNGFTPAEETNDEKPKKGKKAE